jgi:hypothetical protein
MPVTTNPIKITLRYVYLGQECENIQWYFGGGAVFVTATMPEILAAYWAHVQAAWHAIMYDDLAINSMNSILGEAVGGDLDYAEYPIPEADRVGTKTVAEYGQPLPGTLAGAVRLTVGTRQTRPGQKRAPFIGEADINGNDLHPSYTDLLSDWGLTFSEQITLGAPAATAVLIPVITTFSGDPPALADWQDVTGQIVNLYASSQVSRKRGHGS